MNFRRSINRITSRFRRRTTSVIPVITKHTGVLVFSLSALYPSVWVAASYGLLGEAHIGYYRDFYIVKHAIEKTGCVDSVAYSRHHDLTLEDFHFRVRTKAGRVLRLFFSANQNVDRVCSAPDGFLVTNHRYSYTQHQVYGIDRFGEQLRDKGLESSGLRAILCNIDYLEAVFEANYVGDTIPLVALDQNNYKEYLGYLHLEIVDETVPSGWIETPTR